MTSLKDPVGFGGCAGSEDYVLGPAVKFKRLIKLGSVRKVLCQLLQH